jgi:hypothetical protein
MCFFFNSTHMLAISCCACFITGSLEHLRLNHTPKMRTASAIGLGVMDKLSRPNLIEMGGGVGSEEEDVSRSHFNLLILI